MTTLTRPTRMRARSIAVLLSLALLGACGSGDDAASSTDDPSSTTAAEGTTDDSGSDEGDEPTDGGPSDAFCEAAAPIFEGVGQSGTMGPEKSVARYAIFAAAYRAMVAEVDEADGAILEEKAAELEALTETPPSGVSVLPSAIRTLAEPCAGSEVELTWDGSSVQGVPTTVAAGPTVIRIETTAEDIVAGIMLLEDGQAPEDALEGTVDPDKVLLLVPQLPAGGSMVSLRHLEPGSYVVALGPTNTATPTPEMLGVLTVT